MRVLVLTTGYPMPNGTHARMFVHVRNKYYAQHGVDVTVLNFAADTDYTIDGIEVITLKSYEKNSGCYDIAVSHSANVRNHYIFFKKYENKFQHLVFFFHGFEILYMNRDYPKPYGYMKSSKFYMRFFREVYDHFKISLWRRYYKKLTPKSEFIFVSNWLFNRFKQNLRLTEANLNQGRKRVHIINNSTGEFFEENSYDFQGRKQFDFITIRSDLDGSSYCIDELIRIAVQLHDQRFLLIGKGKFFEFTKKPQNMTWISKTLDHEQMKEYLDQAQSGILLTKQDTQGVMACELATYGIPLITSDIDICHEMLHDFDNVAYVPIACTGEVIMEAKERLCANFPYTKCSKFFAGNTISREIEIYREMINN